MKRLPVFLNLEDKTIIIVGGGRAAEIKVRALAEFSLEMQVIAPFVSREIKGLAETLPIIVVEKSFSLKDLEGADIVFAAADEETNFRVWEEAIKRGILCCTAQGKGDFILPAYKKKGDLTVAVSTDGQYPLMAKRICEGIDFSMGERLEELGRLRRWVIEHIQDKDVRKQVLVELLEGEYHTIYDILGRYGYEQEN